MTEKRYEVTVYEKDKFGGLHYCIIDKEQPCHTCRLGYKTVLIDFTKAGCEIISNLLNEKEEWIKELERMLDARDKMISDVSKAINGDVE